MLARGKQLERLARFLWLVDLAALTLKPETLNLTKPNP